MIPLPQCFASSLKRLFLRLPSPVRQQSPMKQLVSDSVLTAHLQSKQLRHVKDQACGKGKPLNSARCRNVIDTASNYRGGRAQKAVGQAVLALMYSRKVARDSLFFSTKAGFTEPAALQDLLSRRRISQNDIDGGMHCIHPACLGASLDQSLRDMRLDTVSPLGHTFAPYSQKI